MKCIREISVTCCLRRGQAHRLAQEVLRIACCVGRHGKTNTARTAVLVGVFLTAAVFCRAKIITVDDDTPADFRNIYAAVDYADQGDTIVLKPGIYSGPGNRDIDLQGKAITIRSMSPLDPAIVSATVIDCQGTPNDYHRAFILHANEDLDGLTLIGGYAGYGGTVYCKRYSDSVIQHCTIRDSTARYGGAVYCEPNSSLVIQNCMMRDNTAEWGGAIYCDPNGSPVIKDCVFRGNTADGNGGGVSCPTSRAKILGCLFEGNTAKAYGGGLRTCFGSDLTIVNCVFRNNSSGDDGGGFECCQSNAAVIGCLFEGNVSGAEGGGIWCVQTITVDHCTIVGNQARQIGGGLSCNREKCFITNSIIRNNLPDNFYIYSDDTEISYCNRAIVDYHPGIGNIDVDPGFAASGRWVPDPCDALNMTWIGGDYHLKSEAGRWDPVGSIWVIDEVTSPCIDGGDPNSPVAFEPYPNGGIVNMGVYGGTAEASKSPSGVHAKYGGGTGEPNDPYLIYTAEHLNAIGAEPNDWDTHMKLMADIDLRAYLYDRALIAPDMNDANSEFDLVPFNGVFDGDHNMISHLTIAGRSYLGLFGQLGSEARILNLRLEAADVNGIGDYIGSLVGVNSGTITTSYSIGTVTGARSVGGLVGLNRSTITTSYSTATVTGDRNVGGLVGESQHSISSSYSTGTVTGDRNVGGLVGYAIGQINTSYSTGTVTGASSVGGMVGNYFPLDSIASSFWDIETSGQTTSDYGVGKTTADMQRASTFVETGWDFVDETENGAEDIWWILEGQDYPRLWWELTAEKVMKQPVVHQLLVWTRQ